MVDIKFHCDEKGNFGKGYAVSAFSFQNYSYTEAVAILLYIHLKIILAYIDAFVNKNKKRRACDVFYVSDYA